MEYQGLIRAFEFLEQSSIVIEALITDRQIARYMRQAHPDITHQFDVWYVSKVNPSLLIIVFERKSWLVCLPIKIKLLRNGLKV